AERGPFNPLSFLSRFCGGVLIGLVYSPPSMRNELAAAFVIFKLAAAEQRHPKIQASETGRGDDVDR
ncbi:MAG: hypothetical protein ACYS22_11080, partial [Planctomycetota bacterium]